MNAVLPRVVFSLSLLCFAPFSSLAWDYEGHRIVNQLALASLPADFPAFALTPSARERVAFLGGEPDRWRNVTDPTLRHVNGPDHYIDLEGLAAYGLDARALPHFRYDFTAQLALARAAHPGRFPEIDPARNEDHTRQLVGFLPWAIVENFDKLKSGFSCLKAYQEDGTPGEIANAQQNILYVMGVMGHYVGDAAQPLHTTIHHHGWVGENPRHYTTNASFHAWIDGGYFQKTGGLNVSDLQPHVHPAQLLGATNHDDRPPDIFSPVMDYILAQNQLVEPLYQLDRDGKLSGEGEIGLQGRAFLTGQLIKAGQMLGNLWYTAWQQAAPDAYLKAQLARRKTARGDAPAKN
ncbi:MAG TPA: hypothetical protein VH598_09530 [Verrucomicrobiae bacterium]|nr:hypothetical protein [Verrucomicrobiae bacterium]